MNDIHHIVFPLALSYGTRGGPQRVTEIATAVSGREQRNTKLSQSRRRYDLGAGVKSTDDLETIITFFEARMGQLYGFLFRDPLDHKSCSLSKEMSGDDQIIGEGDGAQTVFIITKTYSDSAGQYVRDIRFPDPQTLLINIAGTPAPFTFDAAGGTVVFDAPPPAGSVISAGYEFYTPVRFDTPRLDISLETFGAGQAVNLPVTEVLPHDG